MIYQHKHTNLPINVLETIRQGGWHVYNYYYFGMGNERTVETFGNSACQNILSEKKIERI